MKIQLNPNRNTSGLTLGGLIIGVLILIVGLLVLVCLVRLARIPPRELPEAYREELEEEFPGYYTNYHARAWPVHFVPSALDLVTPEPDAPIYEKVLLANDFLVEACMDGTLTNWVKQFHWIIAGSLSSFSMSSTDDNGLPWVRGFEEYESGGVTYQMKDDYSGFDIQLSPELLSTQKCMFWRTMPSQ